MALLYSYYDAYLKNLVTEERETRALEDVNVLGPFPDEWIERLVIVRSYIIVCQESLSEPGDIFKEKLNVYLKEFDVLLARARLAQALVDKEDGKIIQPLLSLGIERA